MCRILRWRRSVFSTWRHSTRPRSASSWWWHSTTCWPPRAYGPGVVLATQTPVDLDYKGLSNAGTWFIGRLQTERDKARLLEGLEGATAAATASFDRRQMEETLAGLGQRIFLMNKVHEDEPVVFQSRWAMSYLRGPMTGSQIKALMTPLKSKVTAPRVP